MKSAYELAMERLEQQSPTTKLTEDQKTQIAEIDSVAKSKIAEREVFLRGEIAKVQAAGKFEEVTELEEQLAREIRRINNDAEEKKEKVRGKRVGRANCQKEIVNYHKTKSQLKCKISNRIEMESRVES